MQLDPFRSLDWRLAGQAAATAVLAGLWAHIGLRPWENDAWHFWNAWADGRLYADAYRPVSEYPYSPAWAQVFWPLTQLAWPVVHAFWTGLQIAALTWMLTPLGALAAFAFPFPYLEGYGTAVYATITNGNPMILTAAAIVAGMRWPAAWSYLLLSKASAGIGVAYFFARREWRLAGLALGTTAMIALVSFVFTPGLWIEWLLYLWNGAFFAQSEEVLAKEYFMPIPLIVRGPLGLGLVLLAGVKGWRWLVPAGCFLALPDIHLGGFAVLTAVPALWLRRAQPTAPTPKPPRSRQTFPTV